MNGTILRTLSAVLAPVCLVSCMVGPNYKRPKPIISEKFKEELAEKTAHRDPKSPWKPASPEMASFDKGKWWEVFHDPTLNEMEEKVATSNQNIKQYEAQYRKAQAEVDTAKANLFPTVGGNWKYNQNVRNAGTIVNSSGQTATQSVDNKHAQWGPSASWTIDIWGAIRRQIQQSADTAQANAALLANMRLSYQLQLAVDYFSLRYQDSLISLYKHNVTLYQRNLTILQNQLDAGVADPASMLQAKYLLQNTKATLESLHINRSKYEHAIAVLMGQAPADLAIKEQNLSFYLPEAPRAVPSVLLQRRPDISQAERNMAAMNAEIGAAIGAYFPQVTLNANVGYVGNPLSGLISAATQFWGWGAGVGETVFNGGARSAAVREAQEDYNSAVANYRQTVLTALQDTEDQLASLHWLARQYTEQHKAVKTAKRGVEVAMNEYLAGTQIYTTVITAEENALSYEQSQLQVQQQRFLAMARLIADIGGGWSSKDLPTKWNLEKDNPFLPSFIQKDGSGAMKKNTKHFPALKG